MFTCGTFISNYSYNRFRQWTLTHVQIQIHMFYKGALAEILDLCLKLGSRILNISVYTIHVHSTKLVKSTNLKFACVYWIFQHRHGTSRHKRTGQNFFCRWQKLWVYFVVFHALNFFFSLWFCSSQKLRFFEIKKKCLVDCKKSKSMKKKLFRTLIQ